MGWIEVEWTHCSLQFSDPDKHRAADIRTLFGFGSHGYTGTEALQADTKRMLRDEAERRGYWMHAPGGTDAWVAVRKDFAPQNPTRRNVRVLDGRKGRWAPKDIVSMAFVNPRTGPWDVSASHGLIKGRKKGDRNYRANRRLWRAVARHMRRNRKKNVIHGTDSNVPDRRFKILPRPILSCWDELKKWPDTHGAQTRRGSTIDILFRIRRWRKKNERMRLKRAYMRGDKKTPMHTDHRPVTAVYAVRER